MAITNSISTTVSLTNLMGQAYLVVTNRVGSNSMVEDRSAAILSRGPFTRSPRSEPEFPGHRIDSTSRSPRFLLPSVVVRNAIRSASEVDACACLELGKPWFTNTAYAIN